MKSIKVFVASGILALTAAAAQAGSTAYESATHEIEVTGLPGLDIHSGDTVYQPAPLYPKLALRRGLGGEVLVQYSIDERGKAENIVILESSPRGFFNNAAVRALQSATFGVTYENGQAVPVDGMMKRFVYIIEETGEEQRLQVSAY